MAEPQPEQPSSLARQPAYASDGERFEDLDLRYGHAYTDSKGVGMRKAGVVLTAVGSAVLGVGIPSMAIGAASLDSESRWPAMLLAFSGYLVVLGIVALSVGIPIFVKGSRRRARYYEWLEEQDSRSRLSQAAVRMRPLFVPGRAGWTIGLRVDF